MSKAIDIDCVMNKEELRHINEVIIAVYDTLKSNFLGANKLLENYASNSEYSQQIKARMKIVLSAMKRLVAVLKIRDPLHKYRNFCKEVWILQEICERDLRNLALSIDFLKNIDCKMGEA